MQNFSLTENTSLKYLKNTSKYIGVCFQRKAEFSSLNQSYELCLPLLSDCIFKRKSFQSKVRLPCIFWFCTCNCCIHCIKLL